MSTSFKTLLLGFMCLGVWMNGYAAVPEAVEADIKAKIEQEMEDSLDKLVDAEALAARFGFDYPVKEPAKPIPAVQAIVEQTIIELAKEKHPASWIKQELEKEAHRFALWRESERVKGMTKDGKPFSGYLRDIKQTSITIDTQRIYFKDLTPETYVHLNAKKADELRNQIRNRLKSELIAMRTRYARVIRLDQTREIYKKEGYIRVFGSWKPKAEFFRERIAAERDRYRTLIEKDLAYKHYYNAGYRLFRGEWYTPEEVARLRREAFIQEELAPESLMALFDKLNGEGRENIVTEDVKTLFGDDKEAPKEDGDGGDTKTDDAPEGEKAEEDVF